MGRGMERGRQDKREGGSGRGKEGRKKGEKARLRYLSRGPEFLVTPVDTKTTVRELVLGVDEGLGDVVDALVGREGELRLDRFFDVEPTTHRTVRAGKLRHIAVIETLTPG